MNNTQTQITAADVDYIIIPDTSVIVVMSGESHMIMADDTRFLPIVEAIGEGDFNKLPNLVTVAKQITNYMKGNLEVKHGAVYWKGMQLHGVVVDRVINAMGTNKDYSDRLLKFIDKLYQNTSKKSIDQLYTFLENKHLALTEDGDFLGYKGLRSDYTSIHSGNEPVEVSTDNGVTWKTLIGHIPNDIGNIVRMPRNLVMDDPSVHCHIGLHIGSNKYSTNFSQGKSVIVKVNPANCVSVPTDHNCQKLRACEYQVIADYKGALNDVAVNTNDVYTEADDDYDECDYYFEDDED